MMKKSLWSLALITLVATAFGQQDPQYTQWQFDRLSVNPAFSGIDRSHSITALHRDQWDGFDRDPKTYLVNYSGMFGPKMNIGGGATFYTEVLGQQQNTIFRVSPSYHHALSGGNYVSVGVSLGMFGAKIGGNWVYIDEDDRVVESLRNRTTSQNAFDMGAGFTFYKPRKYYFGVSSTHLNAAKLDKAYFQTVRHFYVMGGYEMDLTSDLTLRPNVLVKNATGSTQFDFNADVIWNQMLWGGLAFRPGDAIAPYIGFQKNLNAITSGRTVINSGFKLGYSYDVTTSAIKDYSAGSHEVFLTYSATFSPIPIRAKHSNPRFL
ncbi:MAG: type IX secretion system membrane protein PorP/SprF [Flavobacteriales bacterium]